MSGTAASTIPSRRAWSGPRADIACRWLVVFSVWLCSRVAHADSQDSDPSYYEVVSPIRVWPLDAVSPACALPAANSKIALAGIRFLADDPGDKALYVVLKLAHFTVQSAASATELTSLDEPRSFCVDVKQFNEYVDNHVLVKRYRTVCLWWTMCASLNFGTSVSVPFKLRPHTPGRARRIATDVTLGGYAGVRGRLDHAKPYYVSAVATAGLVLLPIDGSSLKTPAGEAANTSVSGFTWGAGLVFELDAVQLGAFYGRDYAAGDLGSQWIYNGKAWWSVSVGYKFFGRANESSTAGGH